MTKEELEILINSDSETEHLEFKAAENSYPFNKGKRSLCGYCVALANELGGRIILGVSDKKPRRIIGSRAFLNINKLKKDLYTFWHRKVDIDEIYLH